MSKMREKIRMSEGEIARFLSEPRTLNVATLGRDGWPHLTALWFVMRRGDPWIWTYAKSQKVKNLERGPKATLLVEAGKSYDELRGVMLRTTATIHRDPETIMAVGTEVYEKYSGGKLDGNLAAMIEAQSKKRIAVEFSVVETISWDHGKL